MASAWERIEAWLGKNAPKILEDLRPPADAAAIAAAEREIAVTLPAAMRTTYGRHDGSEGNAPPLLGDWKLLPLAQVVKSWRSLKELADDGTFQDMSGEPADPRVATDWWNPRWIPIAHNSSGDYRCVDLAPANGGVAGQIIGYWHADARREWLAADAEAWLAAFADDLEAGRYVVRNGRLKQA
jgi:cell wall assembly regulator SMI1